MEVIERTEAISVGEEVGDADDVDGTVPGEARGQTGIQIRDLRVEKGWGVGIVQAEDDNARGGIRGVEAVDDGGDAIDGQLHGHLRRDYGGQPRHRIAE